MKQGKRFSGRYCALVWLPDKEFRYAVFVSVKHGRANRRNRLKRLYREAIRLNRNRLTEQGRMIILPRRTEVMPSWQQVEMDVQEVFDKVGG